METAGETVQSVFQGHWGKVPNISRYPEDQQGATFTEHKLHEIPLEGECSVSPGRQTFRYQCKLTEDRMQCSSSGQKGSRQSQGQRGASLAQHKFHDIPFRDCTMSSGQQSTRNQCNQTESSSQQSGMQSGSHMKQPQNQDPQDGGSSEQGSRRQQNRQSQENPRGNTQSCSSGSSNTKGNKPQDISSKSQGSDSVNPYAGLVDCLRATWMSGKTRPKEFRVTQLEALCHFLEERQADIQHALCEDLHKPCFETELTEILLVRNELANALNNLSYWMKDEKVNKTLLTQLDCAFIQKEPLGVVLIIGAFNFPIQLTLLPLVGAIAAGNCVVLKPSEVSSCTERLLAEALPCYLDSQTFAVVTAGPEETGKLLENKFDYIFYTGSVRVGKIIMTAAAKHVTPLTLELGGKSPCYVDRCCNFQNAANRIVWGKFLNAGQTCIAPDYVICTVETQERLMPCLRQAICEFFGNEPKQSADFGRMVNDRHFKRAQAFLECGRVAIGGEIDECERYIAPTVLADVKEWEPIMQEEVLAPILPIFTVNDMEEAIHFINCRDRPLAVYAFSCDNKVVNEVLDRTSSGGFCGNDTMLHATLVTLPFGGIGCSGFGKYHGKFTFDTFTHFRGCLLRYIGLETINKMRYPPYNDNNLRMTVASMEVRRSMCTLL
ncbi:aldehyde dehydrogenase family 3 member B1-like [Notechis scutatus]|uniref:Aldehyde dehydrogenase family 3 member B1-like n=1 Tax=Notechis scutatus TaxID=8663 RepID=A0A6J1TR42_9SAUR|nr:aldehyde dehydrogenase family 3 member B1-like [Notechis scutatus]